MDHEDATEAAFDKLGLTVRNIRIMHPDGTEELVSVEPIENVMGANFFAEQMSAAAPVALTWDEIGRLVLERDAALAMQATSDRMLGEANARIAVLEDELDGAKAERDALKVHLPDGMRGCTALFRECGLGHGWLTAENWLDHGCPSCRLEAKDARIAELKSRLACEQEKHPDATSPGAPPKPLANPRDVISGEATTYPSAPASKPNHNPFRDFPSDPRRIGGP